MNDTQIIVIGLGVYILIGYGFFKGLLFFAEKSLELYPNVELATLVNLAKSNVFIPIFMVSLWPIVIVSSFGNYLIDKARHKH